KTFDTVTKCIAEPRKPFQVTLRKPAADGSTAWTLWEFVALTDEWGNPTEIQCVGFNITEYRKHEALLAEKERTLSLSLKAAKAGVWVWHIREDFIDWDDQILAIHGLTRDTFDGTYKAWRNCVHPEDIAEAEGAVQLALDDIKPLEKEFRIIKPDGTVRSVLDQAVVVRHHQTGEPLRMIGVIIDITDRVEAANVALERTRLEVELQNQRKLLQQRNRLMSVISHEFRTPMTVILGAEGLLTDYREQLSIEKQNEKLKMISSEVQRLNAMLDDISDLLLAEQGYMTAQRVPTDITKLCSDIIGRIEAIISENHNLLTALQPDLPHILLDPNLLNHALTNLLSNAVKYSPNGGTIKLAVSLDDDRLRIVVADQGIGIPQEQRSQLFSPFFRANNVGGIRGTGLGLSIVAEVVEQHGGTISVESEIDVGTTITIEIPTNTSGGIT
ncbi:MAG: ATP-binding protein, partial [Chloroflexota bacterium]